MIAVCLAMGFDSLTALGIIFCSAACGYAGAMTNAFTLGVAQGIAGLPMFSGIGFRAVVFLALMAVSIVYVTLYAKKVKKNPESSPVYEFDKKNQSTIDITQDVKLTGRQKLVLLTLLVVMIAMVIGIIKFGFYIDELSALFLIGGIVAGVVGGLSVGQIADEFLKGCGNLLFAGLMIGFCNAAIIIMEDANYGYGYSRTRQSLKWPSGNCKCLRYVCNPGYLQCISSIRFRSGSDYNASYGTTC